MMMHVACVLVALSNSNLTSESYAQHPHLLQNCQRIGRLHSIVAASLESRQPLCLRLASKLLHGNLLHVALCGVRTPTVKQAHTICLVTACFKQDPCWVKSHGCCCLTPLQPPTSHNPGW